jgi:hypothetical protein
MRVEDDQHHPAGAEPPPSVPDDGSPGPGHAAWAPPEHYTPEGERRDEPPGPVETPGHYDTGPAERPDTPAAEEASDTDVADPDLAGTDEADTDVADTETAAADNEPVDESPAQEQAVGDEPVDEDVPTQRVNAAGTTYGEPVAEDEEEPAVGVAPVPAEGTPAEADAEAPEAQAPQVEPGEAEAETVEGTEPAKEELSPGDVPVETVAAFWESEAVDGYRDRWQQIQLRFIDDPRQAAEQAHTLVGDVLDSFTEAVQRQREDLSRWRSAQLDDTEELRMTVRRYRDYLDRLLGL